MNPKTLLAALVLWPIPVFNGLVIAIMSSSETSIYRSLGSAAVSSAVASIFYYLLYHTARDIIGFLFPNIWFLILISLSGTAIAIFTAVMVKVNSKRVVMTEHGIEAEFYVKSYKEVENEIKRLGFSCRPKRYVIVNENRGEVEYFCSPWYIQVSIIKELKYYHVLLTASSRG